MPEPLAAMGRLVARGARLVQQPTITLWGARNMRLEDPEGMQITLFQDG